MQRLAPMGQERLLRQVYHSRIWLSTSFAGDCKMRSISHAALPSDFWGLLGLWYNLTMGKTKLANPLFWKEAPR